MTSKVARYIAMCILSDYEFIQSINVVCVCVWVFIFCVCVPVFSSISLDLLPERAATLMVYEDVVEIVSGLQGKNVCLCIWIRISWIFF